MVKQAPNLLISYYPEEHYTTLFNLKTGFFARIEEIGYKAPFWAKHGPELLDISITKWCDKECEICYRDSGKKGRHISITDYESIMYQAKQMQVYQVALGGGNPNQHPGFIDILRITREKYGIVPSFTTNGRGLNDQILDATKLYCGAVAVSAYEPYEEMAEAIYKLVAKKIKTNIHFVLDSCSINTAIRWLNDHPAFLDKVNAIVFLNYKPMGRYPQQDHLLSNSPDVQHFFHLATRKQSRFQVGFDSCLVSGIAKYSEINEKYYDGCDGARFSMFISEEMKAYPCSFSCGYFEGVPITKSNLLNIWNDSDSFVEMRNLLSGNSCPDCLKSSICLGGCPLFKQINLCSGI